jgi:hypothetical protein
MNGRDDRSGRGMQVLFSRETSRCTNSEGHLYRDERYILFDWGRFVQLKCTYCQKTGTRDLTDSERTRFRDDPRSVVDIRPSMVVPPVAVAADTGYF